MVSAEERALVSISYVNAAQSAEKEALRFDTAYVSQGAKTPTGATFEALPRMNPTTRMWVAPGGIIRVSAQAFSADTVESEESNFKLPYELWSCATLPNGRVRPIRLVERRDLNTEDLTGFKESTTNDVALVTTAFTKLGDYTVPNGHCARLVSGKYHAYLGDDS
jgi:hypothetical protein